MASAVRADESGIILDNNGAASRQGIAHTRMNKSKHLGWHSRLCFICVAFDPGLACGSTEQSSLKVRCGVSYFNNAALVFQTSVLFKEGPAL